MTLYVEMDAREERKKEMRYLLILLVLMFANVVQAMDCEKVPDCVSLGYSQQEDKDCEKDGYMYCPFDKSYKRCVHYNCAALGFTESDKTSWCNEITFCPSNASYTLCNRKAVQCKFGDVYYADDTCGSSDNLDSTKTPVGVVFYVTADGRHGRVLAFDEFKISYSVKTSITVQLPLFSNENLRNEGLQMTESFEKENPDLFDGQAQTQKVAAFDPQSAAAKTLNYVPQGIDPNTPYTGKGNWYLPTLGEWKWLFDQKYDGQQHLPTIPILPILRKLEKKLLEGQRYWSINMSSSTKAFYFGMNFGDIGDVLLSSSLQYYIRPIMKF